MTSATLTAPTPTPTRASGTTPAAKTLAAKERLVRTHLQLRIALLGADSLAAPARPGSPSTASTASTTGRPPKDLPLSSLLWIALKTRLGPHPVMAVAGAMVSVADAELRPIATRHPYRLALAAAAVGALAVRTRAWRGWTMAVPLAATLLRAWR